MEYPDFTSSSTPSNLVHLRPISPADIPALRRFHSSLSLATIHSRFQTTFLELPQNEADRFCRVCGSRRVAIVAVKEKGTDYDIVGVVRYDQVDDNDKIRRQDHGEKIAEFACVIQDAYQHHGLGLHMFNCLVQVAIQNKFTLLTASLLATNTSLKNMIAHLNLDATYTDLDDWVLQVTIKLTK